MTNNTNSSSAHYLRYTVVQEYYKGRICSILVRFSHLLLFANNISFFPSVWNLVCGFAQNTPQLLVFRFLAGLGGSAPLAIGGGVLGDVWTAEQRGKAIAVYSLAPLMGPVVGPIAGAWIAQKSTWRWVFWSTTIVDAGIQVAGMFFLQESTFLSLFPFDI